MKRGIQALEKIVKAATRTPARWAVWEFGAIGLLWLAVVGASWPWMWRIGLYYDEAYCLPAAVSIALGSPPPMPYPYVYVLGRPLPFILNPYIGPLDAYLYGLVFAIFGVDVMAFRFTNLAVSLLIVALTYALARQLSNRPAAALAALFLVLDVEFLLHAPTNNVGPILLQMLASTIAVLFLVRWIRRGSGWKLVAAFFCLGVGLLEKLTLVLLLPSLLFATLLFYRRAVLEHLNLRVGVIAVLALLIGCLPVVIYSTANPSFIFEYGSSNGRFPNAEILEERFEQFRTTISGQWSINYIAGQTATSGFSQYRSSSALNGMGRFSVVWWLFWTSLILAGIALARRMFRGEALSPDARICCFLGSLSIGVIGCSVFFPESGRIHHLMVMFPFIHCQAAVTLVWVWKLVSTRHAGLGAAVRLLLVGCVAITAASTFQNMRWHNAHVSRTGGTGVFASEIARLADWISEHPDYHYVFASWGLARPVYTLTAGQCPCREFWRPLAETEVSVKTQNQVRWFASQQDSIFVFGKSFHPPANQERLFQITRDFGLKPKLIKRFHETSTGKTLYELYSFTSPADEPLSPGQP